MKKHNKTTRSKSLCLSQICENMLSGSNIPHFPLRVQFQVGVSAYTSFHARRREDKSAGGSDKRRYTGVGRAEVRQQTQAQTGTGKGVH